MSLSCPVGYTREGGLDDLPLAAVRISAARESAYHSQRVSLETDPPIFWDCRYHCQLVHRAKDFTERHCCSNGASNTHQKRSACLARRCSYFTLFMNSKGKGGSSWVSWTGMECKIGCFGKAFISLDSEVSSGGYFVVPGYEI